MSIAAFAIAQETIAQAATPGSATVKPPKRRTAVARADIRVVAEPR